jgi:hypothetical protein
MVQFDKRYKTFEIWLKAHPEDTQYRRRIISLHEKYPGATLSQLRGHPSSKNLPLCALRLRECSPEALRDFARMARDFAMASKLFDYDADGRIKPWRRVKNEPQ